MQNGIRILMMGLVFAFMAQSLVATPFDEKPKAEVTIYPNPASNYVRINYITNNDYRIVISNILGAVVYKTSTIYHYENSTMLNLTDLNIQNGIYLVKIFEGNNLKATQKLIVRK